jgi:hypothetical protein
MKEKQIVIVAWAIAVAVVVAFVIVPLTLGYMGLGMIGLMLSVPFFAWFASRFLVHGGAGLLEWMSRKSMEEWQGAYYAFNNVQVRVYEDDEGELWFAARDMMLAADMSPIPDAVLEERAGECGRIGDTGLVGWTAAGAERFFAAHPGTEAGKLLLWMRREVVAPWKKRRQR